MVPPVPKAIGIGPPVFLGRPPFAPPSLPTRKGPEDRIWDVVAESGEVLDNRWGGDGVQGGALYPLAEDIGLQVCGGLDHLE